MDCKCARSVAASAPTQLRGTWTSAQQRALRRSPSSERCRCRTLAKGYDGDVVTQRSPCALAQLSPQCRDLDWLLKNFTETVNENFEASLEYSFEALRNAAPNTPRRRDQLQDRERRKDCRDPLDHR